MIPYSNIGVITCSDSTLIFYDFKEKIMVEQMDVSLFDRFYKDDDFLNGELIIYKPVFNFPYQI
jgi:hypothetical protein